MRKLESIIKDNIIGIIIHSKTQENHRLLEKISLDMHDEAKAIVSHKNRLYQERKQIFESGRPYMGAEFVSASKAEHFETIELPAKKKAAEERMRAEQEAKRKAEEERIRAEQEAERKRIAAERERQRRIAKQERQRIKEEELRWKEEQERKDREHVEYLKKKQKDIEQIERQSKKEIRFLIVLGIIMAILMYVRFVLL